MSSLATVSAEKKDGMTAPGEATSVEQRNSSCSAEQQQQQKKLWTWEDDRPPSPELSPEKTEMLELAIDEVRDDPLCSSEAVRQGGKSAMLRYLQGAQWKLEPDARGKRVSEFFLETLQWRKDGDVDTILDRAHTLEAEAASGKMFVRGYSLDGRPLIWLHAGRPDRDEPNPEANIQLLIYTVERAIAMERKARTAKSGGKFCVVIDCSLVGAGGQLPALAVLREAVSMLVLRYPWRLGNLFIVNSGNIIYYLWLGISRLLLARTRDKIVVATGTEEEQRDVLLGYMSAEALEGGRLGCPGAPPFDVDHYLKGGDAGGSDAGGGGGADAGGGGADAGGGGADAGGGGGGDGDDDRGFET